MKLHDSMFTKIGLGAMNAVFERFLILVVSQTIKRILVSRCNAPVLKYSCKRGKFRSVSWALCMKTALNAMHKGNYDRIVPFHLMPIFELAGLKPVHCSDVINRKISSRSISARNVVSVWLCRWHMRRRLCSCGCSSAT